MQQMSLFSTTPAEETFSHICSSLGFENNTPAWPDRFGRAVRQQLTADHVPGIRTLSLFSGAGGLDIGFSDIGFDIVASVEIERKFCDTLELNMEKGEYFARSKVICSDIRDYSGKDLGQIDFVIGGPPCQPFSAAGRRANGVPGTSVAQGVLFREYIRLLQEVSPKGFLFENVYGIIGAQNGKAWEEIINAFSDAGYRLFYRILDSADYGVPQHRERMIIVGLREGRFDFPRPTHGPDSLENGAFYNAGTAVAGAPVTEPPESNRLGGRFASLLDDIPPGLNYSFYTEKMGHPHPVFAWRSKFSDFLYKADPNMPVRTIKASGGAYTGPLHWENRFFTLAEYKRLQTFPDDYQISGNKQLAVKQLGNSVPPQLARIMAIAIRQQVFGTPFPFTLSLLAPGEKLSFRKRKRELTERYRATAQTAIAELKSKKSILPLSRQYYCSFDNMFRLSETDEKNADFLVDVNWSDPLRITVTDKEGFHGLGAKVIVTARNGQWALNVKSVELIIKAKRELAFTAAWRAFERELASNTIKADLVQLNGYYQYEPKLLCRYVSEDSVPFARILKSVVAGEHTARIVTSQELAAAWNVDEEQIMEAAEHLKRLGYEIRNHATNPQIGPGDWLIPYAFPTLTHQSVQLRKKLR